VPRFWTRRRPCSAGSTDPRRGAPWGSDNVSGLPESCPTRTQERGISLVPLVSSINTVRQNHPLYLLFFFYLGICWALRLRYARHFVCMFPLIPPPFPYEVEQEEACHEENYKAKDFASYQIYESLKWRHATYLRQRRFRRFVPGSI